MFLTALVVAAILAFAGFVLSGFKNIAGAIATFVVLLFANWIYFWTAPPIFTGFGWFGIFLTDALVLIVCFGFGGMAHDDGLAYVPAGISAAILVIVLAVAGIYEGASIGQGGADKLAGLANVTMAPADEYPPTDVNHMLTLGKDSADRKANQALSNNGNINTYYDLGAGVLQSVDDHLYYVYELTLGTNNRRNQHKMNYTVPGFVVVDAENPDAASQLRTKDASGQPYKMHFVTHMPWQYSIPRHLWNNGYKKAYVDDLTFEVNDQWQPFYTASVNKPALRWKRAVPTAFITLDPQSGAIKQYQLNTEPEWVDRVYSQAVVKDLLNWWGEWGAGKDKAPYKYFKEGSGNRYKVAGEPQLVYTKGGHPDWQVLMTSYKTDTAVNYIALFDARDDKVTMYSVPSGMTVESTVDSAFRHSPKNLRGLVPADLTLHKIYGRLTWVAPLEPNTDDPAARSFAGLGLLDATNVDAANAQLGTNKSDALDQYNSFRATHTNNNSPNEDANNQTVTGKVSQVSQVINSGQTYVYFLLAGDTSHTYKAKVSDDQPELVFIKVGASVTVGFLDTGVDSTRREVSTYDDSALALK